MQSPRFYRKLYFPVSPSVATQVCVADYKKRKGIDMFGAPADGYIKFKNTSCYSAVDDIDYEGSQFQTEGCLCASCTRYSLEEYHGSDCEYI